MASQIRDKKLPHIIKAKKLALHSTLAFKRDSKLLDFVRKRLIVLVQMRKLCHSSGNYLAPH